LWPFKKYFEFLSAIFICQVHLKFSTHY
jgi:hypothetical protein